MKILFLILSATLFAFAVKQSVRCHVVDKGIVRCTDDGIGIGVYAIKNDGSWINKTMVRGFHSFPKAVMVSVLKSPENWPCTRKDESGCYEVIGGNCEGRMEYFVGIILDGKPLCIKGDEYNSPFEMMGSSESISWTECLSSTHVKTMKYNPIIDAFSDLKEYEGLTPGSYCEDFAATKELYWKP